MVIPYVLQTQIKAQGDYFLGRTRYPFIQYDSNQLIMPETNRLASFYQKTDSMLRYGQGKMNIVHFGGSHLQADTYTHLLRKQLQTLQMDANGGRGFIFPFTMARTNNPRNYKVYYTGNWQGCRSTVYKDHCTWGLNGIQVSTSDSLSSISINPNRDSSIYYSFNSVRVFHSPSPYTLYLSAYDSLYQGVYDSALGYSIFTLPDEIDSLHLIIIRDSASAERFELYGLTLDSDQTGFVYNAIGVNGAMLRHYLDCTLWEQHLSALKPDLVIFSIGTNDAYTKRFTPATFFDRYCQLIEGAMHVAPAVSIIITVPNDSYLYRRYPNRNTALMREQIFKLAEKYQLAVWDFYTIMGGFNSSQAWYSNKLMQYDRIHFNQDGYLLKGELFFAALLKPWEEKLTPMPPLKTDEQYYFYKYKKPLADTNLHLTP